MKDTHLLANVPWDEKGINEVSGLMNTAYYATGIRRGTPVAQYRAVALWTSSMEGSGVLWKKDGEQAYVVAALVPDYIAMLKAGDVVEWRSISTWDSLLDWETTGEGQVVTRVVCRKADPLYRACVDAQPVYNGSFKATGRTGTPFPASVKGYGFTFSRFYDAQGKQIRSLPQ